MKLLIASDIHGSLHYANCIKEAFLKNNCDKLLLLGDLLYHGPRNPLPFDYNPKGVIEVLNSLKDRIIAVRGNCDAEVDQMVLDFPIMSDYTIITFEQFQLFATHGHIYNLDNLPTLQKNDVFLFGHIHIPIAKKEKNYYVVNPGSITLPKENTPHTYAILENNEITIYDDSGNRYLSLKINKQA